MTTVVFALPFEAAGWRPPAGAGVWVLGVGGQRARQAFRDRLARQPGAPSRVILAGLAGALDPEYEVGDVFNIEGGNFGLTGGFPQAAMITIDHIAGTASGKKKLREETGASLCDMETAPLAAICVDAGIPWAGLRAVSDRAGSDLPVPADILLNPLTGSPSTVRLLAHLAGHPGKWAEFFAMVRDAGLARKKLARALDRAVAIE